MNTDKPQIFNHGFTQMDTDKSNFLTRRRKGAEWRAEPVSRALDKKSRKRLRRHLMRSGQIKHAWYSAKMAAIYGNCIYRRQDGSLATISVVSTTRNHGCGWDDMKYLGKVAEFVESFVRSPFGSFQMMPMPLEVPVHRRDIGFGLISLGTRFGGGTLLNLITLN